MANEVSRRTFIGGAAASTTAIRSIGLAKHPQASSAQTTASASRFAAFMAAVTIT
jgi:hypothetical protein